jgi:hypothetical protein
MSIEINVAAVHAPYWIAVGAKDKPALTREQLDGVLTKLDAVDRRIASLSRGPSKHELALADAARAVGCRVYCHSWVGVRSRSATAGDPPPVEPRPIPDPEPEEEPA